MSDKEKTAVIKYGGHAMDLPELQGAFGDDLREMRKDGWNFVIVHGGGPHIAKLLDRMRIRSSFVDGLRVTDEAVLEVVEMALCGQVNKEVTRGLERQGVAAVGISGEDGCILTARTKSTELGRVGEVINVNPALILTLLEGGYVPVIAPLGLDKEYKPLNINADTAAGAIAGAIKADIFVLLSDVPGVLDEDGKLIGTLDNARIASLRQAGVIHGGMIPKVQACLDAIACGSKKAIILDGRQPNSLKNFLQGNTVKGTVIR